MSGCIENVIEFLRGDERATVSFSQGRYISKIKKLANEYPDKVEIVAENQDGSICAHIPVKWVRITPERNLTEEQREKLRERGQLNAKYLSKIHSDDSDEDSLW